MVRAVCAFVRFGASEAVARITIRARAGVVSLGVDATLGEGTAVERGICTLIERHAHTPTDQVPLLASARAGHQMWAHARGVALDAFGG